MIDSRAARYVTTLAECGSIRAAAEKLYLSSPALSMYISNLEEKIGAPLFLRGNKKFVPTKIGELYIRYAKDYLTSMEKFELELAAIRRNEARPITIGIYRRRGISFLVPVMQRLKSELAAANFQFQIGSMQELETMLNQRTLDYFLVTHRIKSEAFHYTHICNDELLLVCPTSWKEYALESPVSPYPYLRFETISHKTMILPEKRQSIYPFIEDFLNSHKIDKANILSFSNMEISVQSVAAELGFCFTLSSYIPTFSHIPGLLFCRPEEKPIPVSWSLAYLENSLDKGNMTVLKRILQEQILAMTVTHRRYL